MSWRGYAGPGYSQGPEAAGEALQEHFPAVHASGVMTDLHEQVSGTSSLDQWVFCPAGGLVFVSISSLLVLKTA